MNAQRTPFEAYEDHAKREGVGQVALHLAYAYYEEQLRELLIEDKKQGKAVDQASLKAYEKTLTARLNVESNFRRAQDSLQRELASAVAVATKRDSLKIFGIDVLGNMLASFLYSLLVFAIVLMAKDQVGSFIRDLAWPEGDAPEQGAPQ